ncbi:MAG: chemotaxis response regulator protein-glutamate methylesterase, partial [Rickettsiales bacterium]|nr:chemotaxis response regulator protein-glutamate methylesterase [Rickettsiales bacterium]
DTADDPFDAREKIKRHNPDVITLDVEMPKMDGISFLEKIMTLRPMPVVMASTLTSRGAEVTLRALELGAVDYICKPEMDNDEALGVFRASLLQKVKQAARAKPRARSASPVSKLLFSGPNTSQLIAVGASTGGVEALRDLLAPLPENTPAMVVTQHMPEFFTASFAKRLDSMCQMHVQEAAEGDAVLPGHVYIAPGNKHLEIVQKGGKLFCHVTEGPLVSGHRPSVDVLFQSVAQIVQRRLVGVILTGMGHDGAKGMLAMHENGALTLGQNEASCVVYGMPRMAMQAGGVEKELPLSAIAPEILKLCQRPLC